MMRRHNLGYINFNLVCTFTFSQSVFIQITPNFKKISIRVTMTPSSYLQHCFVFYWHHFLHLTMSFNMKNCVGEDMTPKTDTHVLQFTLYQRNDLNPFKEKFSVETKLVSIMTYQLLLWHTLNWLFRTRKQLRRIFKSITYQTGFTSEFLYFFRS